MALTSCKTITWSKNGFIAYSPVNTRDTTIDSYNNDNSYNLAVTHMEMVDGHSWRLANPRAFKVQAPLYGVASISDNLDHGSSDQKDENKTTNDNKNIDKSKLSKQNQNKNLDTTSNNSTSPYQKLLPITYVEWSTVGDYLASFDSHGNMTIFGGGICKESDNQYSYSPFNDFVTLYNDTVVDAPVEGKKTVSYKSTNLPDLSSMAQFKNQSIYGDFTTRVIGFEWLPSHKPVYGMKPARISKASDSLKNDNQSAAQSPGTSSSPLALSNGASTGSYQFSYEFALQKPLGFAHPVSSKQACIGIRKNGEICLWYQGTHGLNFNRVTQSLDEDVANTGTNENYDKYLLSHASFGFRRDGSILLATYSPFSRFLKLYLITIDWGMLSKNTKSDKLDSGKDNETKDTLLSPKLSVKRVCREYISPAGANGLPHQLTHLKVVSSNFASDQEQNINLVFDENSKKGESVKHDSSIGNEQAAQAGPASTVFRYQLNKSTLDSNNIFVKKGGQLTADSTNGGERLNSVTSGTSLSSSASSLDQVLNLKEIVQFDQKINNMDTVSRNLFIYFVLEDGKIDIRQMNNLKKKCGTSKNKSNNGDSIQDHEIPAEVMTLYDANFKIKKLKEKTSFALVSPNLSAAVYLPEYHMQPTEKNQFITNKLVLTLAETSSTKDRTVLSPLDQLLVSAAFAVAHSESCFTSLCCDDLIAAIQLEIAKVRQLEEENEMKEQAELEKVEKKPQISKESPPRSKSLSSEVHKKNYEKLIDRIIQESHTALRFSLIYSSDQLDKLLGNPPLQRLLSLQMTLGTVQNWSRSKAGKISWIVLNSRACAFGIMITLKAWYKDYTRCSQMKKDPRFANMSPHYYINSNLKAQLIAKCLGVIKWVLNLTVYVCQDLLNMTILSTGGHDKFQKAFTESLALPILMAKVPRVLLLNSIKGLKQLLAFAVKFVDEYKITAETAVYHATEKLKSMINSSLVSIDLFESFLSKVEAIIKVSLNNHHQRIFQGKQANNGNINRNIQLSLVKIEQKLICQGVIPEELMEASKTIIKYFNDTLRKEVNCSQLYLYDLTWLGLYDTEKDFGQTESEVTEAFKKEERSGDGSLDGPPLKKQKPSLSFVVHNNKGNYNLVETLVISDPLTRNSYPNYLYNKNEKVDYLRKNIIVAQLQSGALQNPYPQLTTIKAISTANGNASSSSLPSSHVKGSLDSFREKRCVRCGLIASIDDTNLIINPFENTKTSSKSKEAGMGTDAKNGDVVPLSNSNNSWDMAFQRFCFCGASWASIS